MNVRNSNDSQEMQIPVRSPRDLLSARQIAEQYPPITRNQVWRWARTGKIDRVELPGGRKLFVRSDLEALLEPTRESAPTSPSAASADSARGDSGEGPETLPGLEGLGS